MSQASSDQNDVNAKWTSHFYRTNSQSRALEQMFVEKGIDTSWWEKKILRRRIKDVLCFLRVMVTPWMRMLWIEP